jgi:LPS export ABC transporter protein LptC
MGIGVLILMVLGYLLRSQLIHTPTPVVSDPDLEEGIKLKDIHYTQDDPDQGMKWVLDAEEVRFTPDRTRFSFRTFQLNLKPEDRPSIQLEGNRGDYDKNRKEISLQGNLHGVTANGYTIKADRLLYRQDAGILTTEDPVTISGPFFTVQGQGLYFDLGREFFRMASGVTTTVQRDFMI